MSILNGIISMEFGYFFQPNNLLHAQSGTEKPRFEFSEKDRLSDTKNAVTLIDKSDFEFRHHSANLTKFTLELIINFSCQR